MIKIPITKPYLSKNEAQEAYDTILSGWVTQGPKVEKFETKFAEYVGSKYAVAVSSCTSALHLSMIMANIKPGDQVICPSMSYIASANAITYVGAIPIFAEVEPGTYNLSIKDVAMRITPKTKAILLVHQMGMPSDIDAFRELCRKNNLQLIEDAACAIGSEYKGKKIGSHSDLVCFSFHPRKIITTGDGGMITTSNKKHYERLKLLRQHGMDINDRVRHNSKEILFEQHVEIGYNYRMTDIQASIGIKQLEVLDYIVQRRREISERYNKAFKKVKWLNSPDEKEGFRTNYQSYCLEIKPSAPYSRDKLMEKLLNIGISTRRGVMLAHVEKAYINYPKQNLTNSERLSENSIIIPLFTQMTDTEVDYVIKSICEIKSNH